MKALKEILILTLLAPFAPVFFILGLFEVKWAVRIMNYEADLSYRPTQEELNLLQEMVQREKAAIRARGATGESSLDYRTNADTGLQARGGVDATGFRIGAPSSNDIFS